MHGESIPDAASANLNRLVDHIDHICQLAGSSAHCGVGSDLDGGFGSEQSPADIESIAGLAKFPGILADRGYSQEDIEGIMHGNFVGFLDKIWA